MAEKWWALICVPHSQEITWVPLYKRLSLKKKNTTFSVWDRLCCLLPFTVSSQNRGPLVSTNADNRVGIWNTCFSIHRVDTHWCITRWFLQSQKRSDVCVNAVWLKRFCSTFLVLHQCVSRLLPGIWSEGHVSQWNSMLCVCFVLFASTNLRDCDSKSSFIF